MLGVSERGDRHTVGTNYKKGSQTLLEKLKYTIGLNTTDGISFMNIYELYPECDGEKKRVLMFQIPAAVAGMPTEWRTRYYARNGESLVPLQQFKIDQIRMQERRDWSRQILDGAKMDYLDSNAIAYARVKYKEYENRPHISEEIDEMTDEEFLTKLKLVMDGKITRAAMLLLGKEEYDYLFPSTPSIMWRLIDRNGELKDYRIYKIPFLTVSDRAFENVRNLTYRYMTDKSSLFPQETKQYDQWTLRELLNNCIAHSNYQLGGRIYINEEEDCINFTNPGDFVPQNVEIVLQKTYSPPFYRNQLLAEGMVDFRMIDTATSGIKKVYRIQRDKYFPMPDYDLSRNNQVSVTLYGKILDQKYTYILRDNPGMDLETVFLLDQVQKGNSTRLSDDAVDFLRDNNMVEGRRNNLYLSAEISHIIDEEAQYIRNKAFDDQYYKDLIVQYLRQYGKAKKKDLRQLLINKLPDSLSNKQKEAKLGNILTSLRKKGIIKTSDSNQQKSYWILA